MNDPDAIDPDDLRRRAASSGGAEATAGRPKVTRTGWAVPIGHRPRVTLTDNRTT